MALYKAILDKERQLRIRKDCVREIVQLDKFSNCFCLVRDNNEIDKDGDYYDDEPLTYKSDFSVESIFKYLDIEAFIKTLKTGFLFKEPSLWPDSYEKLFYDAKYHGIDRLDTPNPLYACCFTTGEETDASWKQYADNSGLGSKCIRLRLNFNNYFDELNKYAEKHNCKIYVGAVSYEYKEQDIDLFYEKGTKWNSFWFTKFSLKNYLSLLLVKRPAYYTEKELRVFVVPDNIKRKNKKLFVKRNMKWDKIITEVLLSPDTTEEELMFVKWNCEKNGIHCPIIKSTLKEKHPTIEIFPVKKDDSFISDIYDII